MLPVCGDEGAVGVEGGEGLREGDREENDETLRRAPIFERSVGLDVFEVVIALPGATNIEDLERGGREEVMLASSFGKRREEREGGRERESRLSRWTSTALYSLRV